MLPRAAARPRDGLRRRRGCRRRGRKADLRRAASRRRRSRRASPRRTARASRARPGSRSGSRSSGSCRSRAARGRSGSGRARTALIAQFCDESASSTRNSSASGIAIRIVERDGHRALRLAEGRACLIVAGDRCDEVVRRAGARARPRGHAPSAASCTRTCRAPARRSIAKSGTRLPPDAASRRCHPSSVSVSIAPSTSSVLEVWAQPNSCASTCRSVSRDP